MIRSIVFAAAALAIGAGAVCAQNLDVIKQRKETMKGVGGVAKAAGAMMKGEAPFDLAKIQAGLDTYADAASKFGGMFPADSKEGGETTVLPKIWESMDDFKAKLAKFEADAKAAKGAITDEATFKTEWPKVMANCGDCHKAYRVPPKK